MADVRNDTTAQPLTLRDRPAATAYGFRVRAADHRGNLSRVDERGPHLGAVGTETGPAPDRRGRRLPFAAVNLISDPIHGYVELTKRLAPDESRAADLHPEDVAEDDLLDTAWVQRLRRISQLQSARWVFPTAEHSRFTHGLGRHARGGAVGALAVPVAAGRAGGDRARRARPVRGPRRRDAADRGPAPRRRPRAVRPLLRRAVPRGLPRARSTPAGPARRRSPTRTSPSS